MSPELITLEQIVANTAATIGAINSALGGSASADGIPARSGDYVNIMKDRSGYSEAYDSASVTDDPFDAMSHEEIYAKTSQLTPSNIDEAANNWRMLGQNASTDSAAFASDLHSKVSAHWQGEAATAAAGGVQRYANSALWLTFAADSLAHRVSASAAGVSATKANVPPPVPYAGGEKILDVITWGTRTLGLGDLKSIQHQHEEAEQLARTVMKTSYAPAISQAAAQVPVLPTPVNPVNGSDIFTVPGGGSGGGFGGGSGGPAYPAPSGGGGSTSVPDPAGTGPAGPTASPQDAATQAASWAPPETAGTTGPAGTTNSTGQPGAGGPGTTNSAAAGNPSGGGAMLPGAGGSAGRSAAPGAGGSRFGGGAGSGSGVGSGRGGFGSSGGLGRGGALPGGALPGAGLPGGGSQGGAGAAGGSTGGRAGAPGMGGMGGMAPAAGRGGAGGDDVHATPGYLIDAVNGDELIGTLPLVAPPVLGE